MLPLTSRLAAQDSAAKMVADRRPAVRARYPHVRACVKMRAALCMPDTDSRRKSDERDGFEMVGTGCRWGWLVRHYLTAQSCLAETRPLGRDIEERDSRFLSSLARARAAAAGGDGERDGAAERRRLHHQHAPRHTPN